MRVGLTGENLAVWLEEQTWHAGRNSIPRSVGDDLAMSDDGETVEWFDRKGNRTSGDD